MASIDMGLQQCDCRVRLALIAEQVDQPSGGVFPADADVVAQQQDCFVNPAVSLQ
ncbi:hypothetical protein AB0I91_07835 [Actinosynnema sp. NPDC049800]